MRRSCAVASLAFDPGPHIAFGIGCVAIEAFGDNFCRRSLAERSLYIDRRAATVADGQSRAVTRGVPRNPMLEIRAVDRPHGCDPTNSGSEGPLKRRRSALSCTLDRYLNSISSTTYFGNCRVLESKPALLLNDMTDQLGRNRTLQYWRQGFGV